MVQNLRLFKIFSNSKPCWRCIKKLFEDRIIIFPLPWHSICSNTTFLPKIETNGYMKHNLLTLFLLHIYLGCLFIISSRKIDQVILIPLPALLQMMLRCRDAGTVSRIF